MSIVGTLIQPRLVVRWGDMELTFDSERPEFTALLSASMQFQDSESYPTCSITLTSDAIGYKAYQRGISEFNEEPIIISVGYPRGSWLSAQFFYSGAQIGSGNSGQIVITGSAKSKEYLSSFKTSVAVETTLKEMIERIQQSGVGEVDPEGIVKPEFSTLADQASSEAKLNGIVGSGVTPGRIIIQQLQNKGLKLGLWGTADPNSPKAKVHSSPVADAEQSVDQPTERPLATEVALGGDSYGFLLGPGLVRDVTRGIQWGPGDGEKGGGSSSVSNTIPSLEEGANAPEGFSAKSPQETVTEESNKQLEITLKGAREREGNYTMSGSCFMVPQIVGLKPRDFLFIPSLQGDYMEDWCLSSVSYDYGASGPQISFQGFRVDLEPGQKMVDTSTYKEFSQKLSGLVSEEDWEAYYWRI